MLPLDQSDHIVFDVAVVFVFAVVQFAFLLQAQTKRLLFVVVIVVFTVAMFCCCNCCLL